MSAARDRAIAALGRNHRFARKIAERVDGHTAAVVISRGSAIATMLPGPARGRVVVAFEGEPASEVVLTGNAVRKLFVRVGV